LIDTLSLFAVGYLCFVALLAVLVFFGDLLCVYLGSSIERATPPVWLTFVETFLFVASLVVLFLDGKML
jgi:hypothetical protein